MKQITAIVLGAGQRGEIYADYSKDFPNELKIVGVAEPRPDHRALFAEKHNIAPENVAADWKELLERDKFADTVFVCTQDRMHFEPVILALEKGYDVLCEKPMSYDRREIITMCETAKKKADCSVCAMYCAIHHSL